MCDYCHGRSKAMRKFVHKVNDNEWGCAQIADGFLDVMEKYASDVAWKVRWRLPISNCPWCGAEIKK